MTKVRFPDLISSEPFFRIRNSLVRSIADVERECTDSFDEYSTYLRSKVDSFYLSFLILLQAWLSTDESNLPNTFMSSAMKGLVVKAEGVVTVIGSWSTEITLNSDMEYSNTLTPSVSYSFCVDNSIVGFWKGSRKVID